MCERWQVKTDIAVCKCKMIFACAYENRPYTCTCSVLMKRHYEKDKRVPVIERKLVCDQRTTTLSSINNADKKGTKRL